LWHTLTNLLQMYKNNSKRCFHLGQNPISNKQTNNIRSDFMKILICLCPLLTTLLQTHKDADYKRYFHEMGKRVTLLPSNGLPNLHLYLDPHMCAAAKPIWYTYNRVYVVHPDIFKKLQFLFSPFSSDTIQFQRIN
jgi:hypothetical protein